MGLHNFMNCPVLIDIKFLIMHQRQRDNQRDFFFFALLPYICFPFLGWVKFYCACFRQIFCSFGRQKEWSVVALDRWLSYTVTIVWDFAWADSALVVLGKCSSYRGDCLNRFDCTSEKHFIILEACVYYFLSIFYFFIKLQAFKNYEK